MDPITIIILASVLVVIGIAAIAFAAAFFLRRRAREQYEYYNSLVGGPSGAHETNKGPNTLTNGYTFKQLWCDTKAKLKGHMGEGRFNALFPKDQSDTKDQSNRQTLKNNLKSKFDAAFEDDGIAKGDGLGLARGSGGPWLVRGSLWEAADGNVQVTYNLISKQGQTLRKPTVAMTLKLEPGNMGVGKKVFEILLITSPTPQKV